MSQDFSTLVSKTYGELVEYHPSLSHCFLVLVKDLGSGLNPLIMKLVPCLNSVPKIMLSILSSVPCLLPLAGSSYVLNYEVGSLLDL